MKLTEKKLFTNFGRVAERRARELKVQELANTAWSFVTVRLPDEKLFAALARAVERRVSQFNV